MSGCVYRTDDGKCKKFTDKEHLSFCVDAPCEYAKQSNADRIRAMTDEELAHWFEKSTGCSEECVALRKDCGFGCGHAWLDWLKQEVDNE